MTKKVTATKEVKAAEAKAHPASKSTSEEAALQLMVGTKIKRIRQKFFKGSQEKLGEQVFDTYGQNIMFRLEKGTGSAIHVFKLLQYFHQNGVNLNFLFEDDLNDHSMMNFNPNSQDSVFLESIIKKYEATMTNLYKLKEWNGLAIEKNINDLREHIDSISKLTTMESIDLEKINQVI